MFLNAILIFYSIFFLKRTKYMKRIHYKKIIDITFDIQLNTINRLLFPFPEKGRIKGIQFIRYLFFSKRMWRVYTLMPLII